MKYTKSFTHKQLNDLGEMADRFPDNKLINNLSLAVSELMEEVENVKDDFLPVLKEALSDIKTTQKDHQKEVSRLVKDIEIQLGRYGFKKLKVKKS